MRNRMLVLQCLMIFFASTGWSMSPIEKGDSLYLEGRFSEALRFYSTALTEPVFLEDTPRIMFYSALCYREMGNFDMALKALWQLVGDYPMSDVADNAYLELAELRERQGKDHLGEALVLYETVLSRYIRSEKLAEAYLGAARVKMALDYHEYAHQTLQNVIDRLGSFEETAQIHYDIATIYGNPQSPKRNIRKALEHLDIVTTRFWGSDLLPDALLLKAKLNWELGNRAEAILYYRDVTTRKPGSPNAEYAQECIARLYEESGDLQRAVNAYRLLQVKYGYNELTRQRLQAQIDRFTIRSPSPGKPTISAWAAREDKDAQRIHYEGDVEIIAEKTRIEADMAEVDYSSGLIRASGKVRLRWNERYVIHCDTLQFTVNDRVAVCSGRVILHRKEADGSDISEHTQIRLTLQDGVITEEGM